MDYLISEDKDFTAQDGTAKELRRHLNVVLTGTFLREVLACVAMAPCDISPAPLSIMAPAWTWVMIDQSLAKT